MQITICKNDNIFRAGRAIKTKKVSGKNCGKKPENRREPVIRALC